jgi:type I restriction enzyme M protein
MAANNSEIENKLWKAADQLRANSKLTASEYSIPVLGLIFLRYADSKFTLAKEKIESEFKNKNSRMGIKKEHYQSRGVLYLPEESRFSNLLELPEDQNIGRAVNDAMKAIEVENDELKDVLPKTYNRLENDVLISLLKNFSNISIDLEGDVFGKIYEYFLGKFAMAEGQRGGEFFTPTSLVKLIVAIIKPFHGRIYDPACGSGGMFVQSAHFVEEHKKNPTREIAIYGQEKTAATIRLCKMNLAVHGLSGDIRQGNTYYEDIHNSFGKFDFVMANPPFNVSGVDKEKVKDDKRFYYGIPRADNGNYLWIEAFANALNSKGRAGFVMANSAGDAGQSELEIRKKLIEEGIVDVMVSIGPNFFYTVTLPCSLWFLDKNKKGTPTENKVLFIDARETYRQIDRAHRDFKPEQIEFLANISRLYRGEEIENLHNSKSLVNETFPEGEYRNVLGLCKLVNFDEIIENGYSLNPGRYVGVAEMEEDEFDFNERLHEINNEFEHLNKKAHELEKTITENLSSLLEK